MPFAAKYSWQQRKQHGLRRRNVVDTGFALDLGCDLNCHITTRPRFRTVDEIANCPRTGTQG